MAPVFAVLAGVIWTLGCIYLPRLEPAGSRRLAIVPLIVIPLIGLIGLAVKTGNPWQEVQDEYDTFVQLGPAKPDTERFTSLSGTRYDLWRVAADQFGDAPLGGVGAGNFTKTYFLERETLENVRQPHSWVMQILAELGLVGLLAFLAFVGGVGWAMVSRRMAVSAARTRSSWSPAAGSSWSGWRRQAWTGCTTCPASRAWR